MALVINTNVPSLNAQRNLDSSQSLAATSLQRLSSGLRINSAKDDAAGSGPGEGYDHYPTHSNPHGLDGPVTGGHGLARRSLPHGRLAAESRALLRRRAGTNRQVRTWETRARWCRPQDRLGWGRGEADAAPLTPLGP